MPGITRGLQLIADFLKFFILAVEKENPTAIMDAVGVAKVWLSDTVTEAGIVKINGWGLVFNSSDPWKPSRAAWQAVSAKWKGVL